MKTNIVYTHKVHILLLFGAFLFFSFTEKKEDIGDEDTHKPFTDHVTANDFLSENHNAELVEEFTASMVEEEKEIVADLFARATADDDSERELGGIERATPLSGEALILIFLAGGYILYKKNKRIKLS